MCDISGTLEPKSSGIFDCPAGMDKESNTLQNKWDQQFCYSLLLGKNMHALRFP